MICWSCRRDVPDQAEFCPHCEAEVMPEPTAEERAAAVSALAALDPEVLGQLQEAFFQSATGEEFVNRVMVGDCPRCDSSKTGDCENDPDIDNPCIGRCFACGHLWCLDCGEVFQKSQPIEHDCPFWKEMNLDDLDDLEDDDDDFDAEEVDGAE